MANRAMGYSDYYKGKDATPGSKFRGMRDMPSSKYTANPDVEEDDEKSARKKALQRRLKLKKVRMEQDGPV